MKNLTDREYILYWTNRTDGCWEWRGCVDKDGYGRARDNQRAHRIAYSAFVGEIPEDLFVCHFCDNPKCCRPEHLWLGTTQDNTQDKIDKGRQPRGEKWNRKLTEDDVRMIRRSSKDAKVLADELQVNRSLIYQIRSYKVWTEVRD